MNCVKKKQLFSAVIALLSGAVCAGGLNLKAAEGDNVTIPFKNAGLERADRVTITLTRENQKNVVARYCRCADCGDCNVVQKQGFLLQVEEGTLTLLDVSSCNSGVYEAKIITDNILYKKNATLDVNKPPVSSRTEPTQPSVSKPPSSSERQRLYGLIAPVFFISVVLGICFFCKCWKEREPLADVEDV